MNEALWMDSWQTDRREWLLDGKQMWAEIPRPAQLWIYHPLSHQCTPLSQTQSQCPSVSAAGCLQGCMFCLSIENLTQYIQGITQEKKYIYIHIYIYIYMLCHIIAR